MGCFHTNLMNERTGETGVNYAGSVMQIIKYDNAHDVTVRFDNGYTTTCEYKSFRKGGVKNPYDKTVYGHGYIGEGKYKSSINDKQTPQSVAWNSMMCRCYSPKFQSRTPSYLGCEVCDEWLNFQNFARWYDDNYYQISSKAMCLDKDIIFKGNKVYSPETCVFVPSDINILFVKRNAVRGRYPIGVNYYKALNKYQASCNNCTCGTKYLGYFDTPEEAFYAYKCYKEQLIKDIANLYRGLIPIRLFNAMTGYVVDIDD